MKNISNGKGSKPRPLSTSYEKYSENYDAIFRKKQQREGTLFTKKRAIVVNPNFVGKIMIIDENEIVGHTNK